MKRSTDSHPTCGSKQSSRQSRVDFSGHQGVEVKNEREAIKDPFVCPIDVLQRSPKVTGGEVHPQTAAIVVPADDPKTMHSTDRRHCIDYHEEDKASRRQKAALTCRRKEDSPSLYPKWQLQGDRRISDSQSCHKSLLDLIKSACE
jgi:hypothetical protein